MVARLRMPVSWQMRRFIDSKRPKMGLKAQKLVMSVVDQTQVKLLGLLSLEKDARWGSN